MVRLYNIDSPINSEQRNNINLTFQHIQSNLSKLNLQVSMISGDADFDAIIQRIDNATNAANTSSANAEQALDELRTGLDDLFVALENSNQSTAESRAAIDEIQMIIEQLRFVGNYDDSLDYVKNNVVQYNGSSFVALQNTIGNTPPILPTTNNQYWQLLAQRGVDGNGAVSAVNSIGPDIDGNVILTPSDIGAATEQNTLNNTIRINNISRSVLDYGAIGDGNTDDTVAIQAAIDDSVTGIIYFPVGNYLIQGDLVIPQNNRKYHFLGQNWNSVINIDSTEGNGFLIDNADSTCIFENLHFSQNNNNTSVINIQNGIYNYVKDCLFVRNSNATVPIITCYASNTQIVNNYFVNNSADSLCISMLAKTGVMHINSTIKGNFFGGVSRGIYVGNDTGSPSSEGLDISNNKFILTGEYSITIAGTLYTSISDNVIDQARDFGIIFNPKDAPINAVSISSNYIAAAFSPTTSVAINMIVGQFPINNTSIINNKIAYSGYGIILSTDSDNNIINSNSLMDIADIGVNMNNSGNVIFTSNNIKTTSVPVLLNNLKPSARYLISLNDVSAGSQVSNASSTLIKANNFGIT